MSKLTEQDIGIIILAAGSSSRMGQSKQLLMIDGEALLLKTIKTALQLKAATVVVLGAREDEHTAILRDQPIATIVNTNWQKGMGSSLKAGLQYILVCSPSVASVIVLVCDQPALTSIHLLKLIQVYRTSGKSIIASYYSHAPGVPALFDKLHFSELLQMDDTHGAKKIIQQHSDKTAIVDFEDGSIDLDTLEDYQNYINRQ